MKALVERHSLKIGIATVLSMMVFVVGITRELTQDRAAAMAAIEITQITNELQQDELLKLEKELCSLRDEMQRADDKFVTESRIADKELQNQTHRAEVAYAEMKTELAGVKAMLIRIETKLNI
jgi:hypothetical protein